jgi:hypothetical protein
VVSLSEINKTDLVIVEAGGTTDATDIDTYVYGADVDYDGLANVHDLTEAEKVVLLLGAAEVLRSMPGTGDWAKLFDDYVNSMIDKPEAASDE